MATNEEILDAYTDLVILEQRLLVNYQNCLNARFFEMASQIQPELVAVRVKVADVRLQVLKLFKV